MIKNKIIYTRVENIINIQQYAKVNNYHFAELCGNEIQSWDEYINLIESKFCFPTKVNVHGYVDWMKDLDWLNKDGYILIIKQYNEFLQNDISTKKLVIELFKESILPWWEKDIELYVGNGIAKNFTLYLIN